MLSLLLLTVAIIVASCIVGQAVLVACGSERWRWWAPAVGYAILIVVGAQAIRLPHRATTAAIAIAVITVVSVAFPSVRKALCEAAPDAVPLGLGLTLLAAIPFFASGGPGVLGARISNDMSAHLLGAYYIRTQNGLPPMAAVGGDLVSTGYPLGPHGLAAALTAASGLGEVRTLSAVMLAVPTLTAFAALGFVPSAPRVACWALGAGVGLGYLPAAYLAQASFKEIIQALFVLAATLALADLAGEEPPHGPRRGVPLGALGAGAVYTYSYAGAFWLIGVAGMVALVELARRPRTAGRVLRGGVIPVLGAVLIAVVLLLPEIGRIRAFERSIFGAEAANDHGNLFHALDPLETFGVWFSDDFRLEPVPRWPTLVFVGLALGALVAGLGWWWRRRALALPAAIVAALVMWADLALTRSIYNAAKGLVVLAPLVTVGVGAPLAACWSARGRSTWRRGGLAASRALGVVLLAAAALSTGRVLRSASVGLGPHARELGAVRDVVGGDSVLFLNNDDFAQWELRGTRVYTTSVRYPPGQLAQHRQKRHGAMIDVDNFEPSELDKVHYLLTSAGHYQSEPPANFRLALRTQSYALYRRVGRTPPRAMLERPGRPGVVLDCHTPRARAYVARYRWAFALPRPVVRAAWQGDAAVPGHTARITVTLPAGRWDVSLQYISRTGMVVRASGLRTSIPANFGSSKAFWPAGTLTSRDRPLTLSITARDRGWFGRLLGSPAPLGVRDAAALSWAAFTRHGARPRRLPARAACGRYIDWLAGRVARRGPPSA